MKLLIKSLDSIQVNDQATSDVTKEQVALRNQRPEESDLMAIFTSGDSPRSAIWNVLEILQDMAVDQRHEISFTPEFVHAIADEAMKQAYLPVKKKDKYDSVFGLVFMRYEEQD